MNASSSPPARQPLLCMRHLASIALAMAAVGYPLDDRESESALRSLRHHFRGIESEGAELEAGGMRIPYALTRPPAAQPSVQLE
ncbi:MAG: hypothetical protein QM599_05025 [Pseudoxanthomonas sp.]